MRARMVVSGALAALAFSAPVNADAPRESIGGWVADAGDGAPIEGALVRVVGHDDRAATSDSDGTFEIRGAGTGEVDLLVTADGYRPIAVRVAAGSAGLRIELRAGVGPSEVVVVSGEAPDTGQPATYDMSADEARSLPGSGSDTLKAVQSLPGVARVPYGVGGLVLRGTSPRDSNVYLDGIEVPVAYHFGGLASVYPASLLASLELVPGSFGAEYGRAQGGLVLLRSRPGRRDRWSVAGEASVLDASARAEGPGSGDSSWSIAVRRSYVDAILAWALPERGDFRLTLAPRYYDGQLRYDRHLGAGERLTLVLFGADDRMRLLLDEDGIRYQSSFLRVGAAWSRQRGKLLVEVTPWVGLDRAVLGVAEEGVTRSGIPFGARAVVRHRLGEEGGYLAGGVDVQGARYAFEIARDAEVHTGADWYADAGAWIEGFYAVEDGRLGARPGLRVERYGLGGEWVADPRLVVSHRLARWFLLRESLGVYHQPPLPSAIDPGEEEHEVRSSHSVQGTVGVEVGLAAATDLALTVYHDELYRLPVAIEPSSSPASEGRGAFSGGFISIGRELAAEQVGGFGPQANRGHGRSSGVELLLEHAAPRWRAWIAYTYSRTSRSYDPQRFIDYRPYILDQPHLLTALSSVRLGSGWRLGARARYATGNPYTPVAGTYVEEETGEIRPIDGPILSARLPAFFQLDLRVDRTWERPWGRLEVFIDVQNATNRLNAEGVGYNEDFSSKSYTRGLPIIPALGLSYLY